MGWRTWGLSALVAGMMALPVIGARAAPLPDSGCGSTAPSLSPGTLDEQTLVGYFEALNARNYGAGALPAFWTVDDGTIVEVGTGP